MPEDFDVVNALIASSSIPGYTKTIVEIEGRRYSDGLSTCNDPIGYAINELRATDILVVLNSPLRQAAKLSKLEKARDRILLKDFPSNFVRAHQRRHSLNGLVAEKKYQSDITIGVLCPDQVTVSYASMNSKLLKKTAEIATLKTMKIFE